MESFKMKEQQEKRDFMILFEKNQHPRLKVCLIAKTLHRI